ncbi:unnamed protein product [Protopolystoma xenopodis]|uniref:glutathione gamma-glutamylcysteinyltransferase n=1 Tax=Protopolystoma xenopodis TaxID=117903 RepID=A0A3S5CL93_9PLAT|nr:unnamed protein product [Protopolystoma xenopodis]
MATLVIILNTLEVDPGRVWKAPWRWYHEEMLTCCLPPDALKKGIVLDQFVSIAKCNGLNVELHRATENESARTFREVVAHATRKEPHHGIIAVSFARSALRQTGGGHFSVIAGYHPDREMVLLLDTARFKYPPHWAPLGRLWKGMCDIDEDTQLPRGYMLIRREDGWEANLTEAPATKGSKTSGPQEVVTDIQEERSYAEALKIFVVSDAAWQVRSLMSSRTP